MSAGGVRRVALLGATGSIGASALRVAEEHAGQFELVALSAGRNVESLAQLALRWRPQALGVADAAAAVELQAALARRGVVPEPEIVSGPEGLRAMAAGLEYDVLLLATVGVPGLGAAEAALLRGKTLALANKEALVAAGAVLLEAARRGGGTILPVDSEHSALHQCLRAGRAEEVERVILTASGGPFLDWPPERIAAATPAQALRHPTWHMGRRITTDSATLMNKGFELLEACHLFALDESQIEVVIHPQSLVHSLVAFRDGSMMAQLSTADMCTPIQYALTYPHRQASNREKLDLGQAGRLEFRPAPEDRLPALRLAREAWRAGGGAGAVLNAADEIAVGAFLAGRLPFLEIVAVVEEVLGRCPAPSAATLDEVLAADQAARQVAEAALARRGAPRHSAAARP
ncbi:MAG: 1-deoxy-D-xylulose-5-phosphate reductoisomerase [Terriglobales bacterium]